MSAFADREAQAFLHRHRRDQLNHQLYVVSGHHHLGARGKLCHSGDIRRAQIKLRAISLEERRVPSAFFFRQNVNLSFELGVWRDRTTFRQHHATLHFIFADTAQQKSSIVSRHAFIELLLEHLHAGDHRLSGLAEADDFNFFSHLHLAALDSARDHRAAPRDREDILNRHQERLFNLTLRYRHILVHRLHQLVNLLLPLGFAIQRAQRGKPNHRNFVSRKLIALQQLAHFQFHQIEQLRIIHRLALVERHDDIGHTHLPRQQHVLSGLRHGAVGGRHYQNRAIHLRRARDHILDVVGVAGAIHVRVVPLVGLVLDVRRGDGDAAGFLFRRVIDAVKRPELNLRVVLLQYFRDRRRQRGLAMINMTDRAHVHVRFGSFEFLFRHVSLSSSSVIAVNFLIFRPQLRRYLFHFRQIKLTHLRLIANRQRFVQLLRCRSRFCERVRFLQDAVCQNRLQVPHPASRAVHSLEKLFNFLSCQSANYRALQFLKFLLSFNLNGRLLKAHNIPTLYQTLERETGIEPATNSLEGCDSTTELLPLSYSRSNCPAFSISEVLGCAQDLGGGLKRPPIASTWKAVTLPLSYSRPHCHFTLARSFAPLRISAAGSQLRCARLHARKTPQVTPAKTSCRLSAVSSQ